MSSIHRSVVSRQSSVVSRQSSVVSRQSSESSVKVFARLSSALIGGILLLNSSGSWANTSNVTISGTASFTAASDPLGGISGCNIQTGLGVHNYASQKFSTATGASTVIETTAASLLGGMSDTFIAFYSPSFNPASPTTNLITCNDDIGGGSDLSKITYVLVAGTQYEIVVTTFDVGAITGTATLSFTPDVTLGGLVINNTVSAPLFSTKEKAAVFSQEVK